MGSGLRDLSCFKVWLRFFSLSFMVGICFLLTLTVLGAEASSALAVSGPNIIRPPHARLVEIADRASAMAFPFRSQAITPHRRVGGRQPLTSDPPLSPAAVRFTTRTVPRPGPVPTSPTDAKPA